MVKFGKNKFKALNKIAKNQKVASSSGVTNKILKKRINADKKVSFQKEVLLKESVGDNKLVKTVTAQDILVNELSKKLDKKVKPTQQKAPKPKQKSIDKKKKRQKTQINDKKMLLNLMKKK